MTRTSRWFATALLAPVALLVAGLAAPAGVRADEGLGGGFSFRPGTVFPLPQGSPLSYGARAFVQSTYATAIEVAITSDAPPGIRVSLDQGETVSLVRGGRRYIPFTIGVDGSALPGRYPVNVSILRSDVPRPSGGGVAMAPAIVTSFVVEVVGASATVTVNAVSRDDGRPITGDLTLTYAGSTGDVVLAEVLGSTLTRAVAPGPYRATFTIPGLVQETREFTIVANEAKTVTIEVTGVQFITAAANPVLDGDRGVVSANLVAIVRNNLEDIQGPVDFSVEVRRDGDPVETVQLASLPVLPTGDTTQRSSYRPPRGFSAGVWSFHFVVTNGKFTVMSNPDPTIEIPGVDPLAILGKLFEDPILALVLVLSAFLLVGRIAGAILGRRRPALALALAGGAELDGEVGEEPTWRSRPPWWLIWWVLMAGTIALAAVRVLGVLAGHGWFDAQ